MAIIVPNTASSITANGSIVGGANVWAWVGLRTAAASGSATWYSTTACTSGCELISFSLSPHQAKRWGPFNSPCGLYVTGITAASAIVWLKRG